MFTIRDASAQELLALRLRVLRPGRPESAAHFPGDDLPTTRHFVALDTQGTVVGCASVLESEGRLQLRGMATAPEWQGKGVGRAVLEAVQAHAQQRQLPLWCNARVSALPFYEKLGWECEGERFEVPDVGPHFKMNFIRNLTMEKQPIFGAGAAVSGAPYTPAVRAGNLLFISGQLGLDPETKQPYTEFAAQVEGAIAGLKSLVEAAGGSLESIVKTTIFLSGDMSRFAELNGIYAAHFQAGVKPARSTFAVAALPLGALVEIEAIAVL